MNQQNKLFDDYIKFTRTTAIYPLEQNDTLIIEAMYLGLGLSGEAGEVAGKIKKLHRDGWSEEKLEALCKEMGDVTWYLARLCDIFGVDMEQMMLDNMAKLQDRKDRGVLGGSGDNR